MRAQELQRSWVGSPLREAICEVDRSHMLGRTAGSPEQPAGRQIAGCRTNCAQISARLREHVLLLSSLGVPATWLLAT